MMCLNRSRGRTRHSRRHVLCVEEGFICTTAKHAFHTAPERKALAEYVALDKVKLPSQVSEVSLGLPRERSETDVGYIIN